MKRLLEVGAIMMLVAAFVPLLELFDRWDQPGLSNDTEYAVFGLVLTICLVLLVCKLISSGALLLGFISARVLLRDSRKNPDDTGHNSILVVPPRFLVPLRI